MDPTIQAIYDKVSAKIGAKIAATPDPTKILAADLDEILKETLTELDASTTGTLDPARLPANVALKDITNIMSGLFYFQRTDPTYSIIVAHNPNENWPRYVSDMQGNQFWSDGSNAQTYDVSAGRQDAGRYRFIGKLNATVELQEAGVSLATKYGKVFKTGTVVDFVAAETHFGTEAAPETGNITANMTGAGVGNMAKITHNSGVEPTIDPAVFHKISGSGDYALGVNNYIIFDCLSSTKVNYSITQ